MNRFNADADTMNALHDSLAMVVTALTQTMPPQQRQAFADNLAHLAKRAEQEGMATLETALIDLHRAACR